MAAEVRAVPRLPAELEVPAVTVTLEQADQALPVVPVPMAVAREIRRVAVS